MLASTGRGPRTTRPPRVPAWRARLARMTARPTAAARRASRRHPARARLGRHASEADARAAAVSRVAEEGRGARAAGEGAKGAAITVRGDQPAERSGNGRLGLRPCIQRAHIRSRRSPRTLPMGSPIGSGVSAVVRLCVNTAHTQGTLPCLRETVSWIQVPRLQHPTAVCAVHLATVSRMAGGCGVAFPHQSC